VTEPLDGLTFYYRGNEPALHVRDLHGGHHTVVNRNGTYVATAQSTAAPWYNRVAWRGARSTRGRSPDFKALFASAAPNELLSSGLVALPASRSTTRRVPNQGMTAAMTALFAPPVPTSATLYANALGLQGTYEWCHLVAHSMRGGDGPLNVVGGTKNNNSEQLIIENLLSTYGQERCFGMTVTARLQNPNLGQHMGVAIRYEVSDGNYTFTLYFDSQTQNQPSGVHVQALMEKLARWLNQCLVDRATVHLSNQTLQDVLEDCPQFAKPSRKRDRNDDLGDTNATLEKRRKRK
jgi:hypothetical protein